MRLPSQCIRFEESIIFLEGVMNSDFAHTSIIYHEHIDVLCIHKFTSNYIERYIGVYLKGLCYIRLPEAFGHVVP